MEGEACASKIMEVGPAGAKFLGPVLIEVPHFASLRGKEREIIILRSDTGEVWREHLISADDELIEEIISSAELVESNNYDQQQQQENVRPGSALGAPDDVFGNNRSTSGDGGGGGGDSQQQQERRLTRIVTNEFPQYFAIISRIRQEVHTVGPDGLVVDSQVVPRVQAIFTDGALTKRIKIGLQKKQASPDQSPKLEGKELSAVAPQQQNGQSDDPRAQSPSSIGTDGGRARSPSGGRPGSSAAKRRSRFLACFGAGHGSHDLLDQSGTDGDLASGSAESSSLSASGGGDSPRQPVKEKLFEKRHIIEDISDSEHDSDSIRLTTAAAKQRKKRLSETTAAQLVPDDYYIEKESPLILNGEPKTYGKRMASSSAQTDQKLQVNGFMSTSAKSKRQGLLGGGKRWRNKTQMTIPLHEPIASQLKSASATGTQTQTADEAKPAQVEQQRPDSTQPSYKSRFLPHSENGLVRDSDADQKMFTRTIQTDSESVTVQYVTIYGNESAAAAAAATIAPSGQDDGYVSGSGDLKKDQLHLQQQQQHDQHKSKGLFSPFCGVSKADNDDDQASGSVSLTDEADDDQLKVNEVGQLDVSAPKKKKKSRAKKQSKKQQQQKKKSKSPPPLDVARGGPTPESTSGPIERQPSASSSPALIEAKAPPPVADDATVSGGEDVDVSLVTTTSTTTRSVSPTSKELKSKLKLEKQARLKKEKAEKQKQRELEEASAKAEKAKKKAEKEAKKRAEKEEKAAAKKADQSSAPQSPEPAQMAAHNADDKHDQETESTGADGKRASVGATGPTSGKTVQSVKFAPSPIRGGDSVELAAEKVDEQQQSSRASPAKLTKLVIDSMGSKLKDLTRLGSSSSKDTAATSSDEQARADDAIATDNDTSLVHVSIGESGSSLAVDHDVKASKEPVTTSASGQEAPTPPKSLRPILKQQSTASSADDSSQAPQSAEITAGEPRKSLTSMARQLVEEATEEAIRAAALTTVTDRDTSSESQSASPVTGSSAESKKEAAKRLKAEREQSKRSAKVVQDEQKRLIKEAKKLAREADEAAKRAEGAAKRAKAEAEQGAWAAKEEAVRQAGIAQQEAERALAEVETAKQNAPLPSAVTAAVVSAIDEADKILASDPEASAKKLAKEAKLEAKRLAKKAEAEAKRLAKEADAESKARAKEAKAEAKREAKEAKKKMRKVESGLLDTDSPSERDSSALPSDPSVQDSSTAIEPDDHQLSSKSTSVAKDEDRARNSAPVEVSIKTTTVTSTTTEAADEIDQAPKVVVGETAAAAPIGIKDEVAEQSIELNDSTQLVADNSGSSGGGGIKLPKFSLKFKAKKGAEGEVSDEAPDKKASLRDQKPKDEKTKKDKKQKKTKAKTSKKTTTAAAISQSHSTLNSSSSASVTEPTVTASKSSFLSRLFRSKPKVVALDAAKTVDAEAVGKPAEALDSLERQKRETMIVSEMYPSDPNNADGEMILEVNVPENMLNGSNNNNNNNNNKHSEQVVQDAQADLSYRPEDTSELPVRQTTLATSSALEPTTDDQEATLVNLSQMADDEADDDEATENVVSQTNDLASSDERPSEVQISHQHRGSQASEASLGSPGSDKLPGVAKSEVEGQTGLTTLDEEPAVVETEAAAVQQQEITAPAPVVPSEIAEKELKNEKNKRELEAKLDKEAKKRAKEEEKLRKKQEADAKKAAEAEAKKAAKEERERLKREAKEAKRLAELAKKEAKREAKEAKKAKKNKSDDGKKGESIPAAAAAGEQQAEPEASDDKQPTATATTTTTAIITSSSSTTQTTGGLPLPDEGLIDENSAGRVLLSSTSEVPINEETEMERIVEEVVGEDGTVTKTTKTVETKYVTMRQEELRVSELRDMPAQEWAQQQIERQRLSESPLEASVEPKEALVIESAELDEIKAVPSYFDADKLPEGVKPETAPKRIMGKRIKLNQKLIKQANKLARSEAKKAKTSKKKAEAAISVCDEAARQARKELKVALKEAKRAAKEAVKQHKKMDKVDKKLAKQARKLDKRQKKIDKRLAKMAKKAAKKREKEAKKEAKRKSSSSSRSPSRGSKKSIKLEDISEPILRSSSHLSIQRQKSSVDEDGAATAAASTSDSQLNDIPQQQQRNSRAGSDVLQVDMSLDDDQNVLFDQQKQQQQRQEEALNPEQEAARYAVMKLELGASREEEEEIDVVGDGNGNGETPLTLSSSSSSSPSPMVSRNESQEKENQETAPETEPSSAAVGKSKKKNKNRNKKSKSKEIAE